MKKNSIAFFAFLALFGILKIFNFSTEKETQTKITLSPAFDGFTRALEIPQNLDFAGEKIPTDLFDVSERLDRELLINTYWQSQTILMFKRAHRWFPVIEPILKKNNIPDDFKFLALAESGLLNVISPAGATGFWQFLSGSAKQYGLVVDFQIDERYSVEKSTEAACKYLQEAFQTFGSWSLTAASYNMGIEGLKKQLDKQRESSYYDLYLNDETSRYLFRLVAFKEVFSHPEKYGFKVSKKYLYPVIPTKKVEIDSSITSMVDFAEHFGINYKTLKLFNPWLRQYTLLNKEKLKYRIDIPDSGFSYLKYLEKMVLEDSLSKE